MFSRIMNTGSQFVMEGVKNLVVGNKVRCALASEHKIKVTLGPSGLTAGAFLTSLWTGWHPMAVLPSAVISR